MESFRRNVWNQSEGNTPTVMPYTLCVITFALQRLHTNPLDWIKKEQVFQLALFCERVTKRSRIEVKVSKSSVHAPLDRLKYVSY